MATFTFTPSFTADLEEQPIIRRVKFGDGYEQRLSYGLNTQPKKWSLQFLNRTDTERNNILTFLRARGAVESFVLAPSLSTPPAWRGRVLTHVFNWEFTCVISPQR